MSTSAQTSPAAPQPVDELVITALATRQGTDGDTADAARFYTAAGLTTAAVVVDGIGHARTLWRWRPPSPKSPPASVPHAVRWPAC